jgi:hypothetical protein
MSASPRPAFIPDWELWGCALEMVKSYGDDAAPKALDRADQFNDSGDIAGGTAWLLIAQRIADLQDPQGRV